MIGDRSAIIRSAEARRSFRSLEAWRVDYAREYIDWCIASINSVVLKAADLQVLNSFLVVDT